MTNHTGASHMMHDNRRSFLKCMVWAGTGVLWTVSGGVPRSRMLDAAAATVDGFSFVQISDSHIGFAKPPNLDTTDTLQEAVRLVAARKGTASLLLHTGDVSQLSKPEQFDTAHQVILGAGMDVRTIPGEHDVLDDDGRAFFGRFTPGAARGWYSFDQQGVHFVALNNVQNLKAGASATSVLTNSRGCGATSPHVRTASRSWCSRTSRSGPSAPSGVGAPTTPNRRLSCCAGSARSPC